MFSGIVEDMATLRDIRREGANVHFTFNCSFVDELHIDQSIAHDGVCLTVAAVVEDGYVVTAMQETLLRTNLGKLCIGDRVNVERSMLMNGRLDGHIVQGHVDTTARCIQIEDADGSKYFTFCIEERDNEGRSLGFADNGNDNIDFTAAFAARKRRGYITVDKGSVTVNGVSLTVCNPTPTTFQVAIIPYTMEHTNFGDMKVGTIVNIEFDILGKYIANLI